MHQRWSQEQANTWYKHQPWMIGCNFIPSNAINQLEMWQAETFDPETIDRELGWAADLGFNTVRVYLHDLLWLQDAAGFKARIDQYLEIAAKHNIRTMFVLFDDCWHDDPKLGPQPDPVPGVHNSGWVKSPGTKVIKAPSQWERLEAYVGDIVGTYRADPRIAIWDVYNEPSNHFLLALGAHKLLRYPLLLGKLVKYYLLPEPTAPLLRKAFDWARAANPAQPLTSGLWYLRPNMHSRLNSLALELSDVISFHSYFDLAVTTSLVNQLKTHNRPLLCTEYLARTAGSHFETILPLYKQEKIGSFNWGLVSGKTQTIYSWEEAIPSGREPETWFHDILRQDGTPYRKEEADFIGKITRAS